MEKSAANLRRATTGSGDGIEKRRWSRCLTDHRKAVILFVPSESRISVKRKETWNREETFVAKSAREKLNNKGFNDIKCRELNIASKHAREEEVGLHGDCLPVAGHAGTIYMMEEWKLWKGEWKDFRVRLDRRGGKRKVGGPCPDECIIKDEKYKLKVIVKNVKNRINPSGLMSKRKRRYPHSSLDFRTRWRPPGTRRWFQLSHQASVNLTRLAGDRCADAMHPGVDMDVCPTKGEKNLTQRWLRCAENSEKELQGPAFIQRDNIRVSESRNPISPLKTAAIVSKEAGLPGERGIHSSKILTLVLKSEPIIKSGITTKTKTESVETGFFDCLCQLSFALSQEFPITEGFLKRVCSINAPNSDVSLTPRFCISVNAVTELTKDILYVTCPPPQKETTERGVRRCSRKRRRGGGGGTVGWKVYRRVFQSGFEVILKLPVGGKEKKGPHSSSAFENITGKTPQGEQTGQAASHRFLGPWSTTSAECARAELENELNKLVVGIGDGNLTGCKSCYCTSDIVVELHYLRYLNQVERLK
ncbi:hypothetical protein WN51_04379 [Melipona quadrifasciata]|uniref:Uncharacterized protein n=1 Tax=Melipona quadrifasciata TaxID=166423 RepID=A0A0N0BCY8_9HYME|nr:hypothetical protein WN51_04379 [Melipona quadrifasciata]